MFKKLHYLLLMGLIFYSTNIFAQDPPEACVVYSSSTPEILEAFNFNDGAIDYKTTYEDGRHIYINTGLSANVEAGKSYPITGSTGLWYTSYYSHFLRIFVDWNRDGNFDDENELLASSGDDMIAGEFEGTLTMPFVAPNIYRMRITTGESYSIGVNTGCGDLGSYPQAVDFYLKVNSGLDAGVTSINSPINLFKIGMNPIIVNVKNFGKLDLTNFNINISINGITQQSFIYNEFLRAGENVYINLGDYNLTYGPNGPYNAFNIKVWTSDLNGTTFDDDNSNDLASASVTPILNDAGPIGVHGPQGGFGPGSVPVYAKIKNFAPKPLTAVTINWKVDGVDQGQVVATGLNIPYNQSSDVFLGNYTFINKSPLGPYDIEITSSKPNTVNDEYTANDTYTGILAPALVAGTYYVGGANPHFDDVVSAFDFLNASGVFGPGQVTFVVRPGTYVGNFSIFNQPKFDNPIELVSSTGSAYDVRIQNAGFEVGEISDVSNITFNKVTFQNTGNAITGGNVLNIRNSNNIKLINCQIDGVVNAPKSSAFNSVQVLNSDIYTYNTVFNYGSYSIYVNKTDILGEDGSIDTVFNYGSYSIYVNKTDILGEDGSIKDNGSNDLLKNNTASKTENDRMLTSNQTEILNSLFENFSMGGIQVIEDNTAIISNNTFKWTSGPIPNNGIHIDGNATITNNVITGITGTGAANEGIIKIDNSTSTSTIEGNTLSGQLINGLYLNNANVFVHRNYITVTQGAMNNNALVYLDKSHGWFGNNIMLANGLYGFNIQNSDGVNIAYNTIQLTGDRALYYADNSYYRVARNININNGTSYNYENISGTPTLYQNFDFSAAMTFANINGDTYATLADFIAAGYDEGSQSGMLEFISPTDLHIKTYIDQIYFGPKIFAELNNMYANIIENTDYDGETRTSYFAGADEIFLTITVHRQSDGFLACEHDSKHISVSADMNYGGKVKYQWYKDGRPIENETNSVLYFPDLRFDQAAVYNCELTGPGSTIPTSSKPVTVFVATKTEITEQPMNTSVVLKDLATLKFRAHVNGKDISEAIDAYEVSVQWYRIVNDKEVLLKDNDRFSGSLSNYLTIRNFAKTDEGTYFAEIVGLCGTVRTDTINLLENTLDITIVDQPANAIECADKDVVFTANVTTKNSLNILYQWLKNGVELVDNDGQIEGAKTNTLTLKNIQKGSEGQYSLRATLEGTSYSKETLKAQLTVNVAPVIKTDLTDLSLKVDDNLELKVDLVDNNELGLTYQWFKNDVAMPNETNSELLMFRITQSAEGTYHCVISNSCGQTTTKKAVVTVTNTGQLSITNRTYKNNYMLSTPNPNPVSSNATLEYYLAKDGLAKISICNNSGAELATILNQFQTSGDKKIDVNIDSLNLTSGAYFIKLEVNGIVLINNFIVVK